MSPSEIFILKGVECLCFIQINENPHKNLVDDCVIRAIATATGRTWDDVYLDLMIEGFTEKNYPNYNSIWWSYLVDRNWIRYLVKDTCPLCYTLKDFVKDHKYGIYLVGDGSHVVAVVDGNYIDTYDSGNMSVLYYFRKEK